MRVTEREVDGYAHCARFDEAELDWCPGNEQQPVRLIEQTVEYTFRDGWGGRDIGGPTDIVLAGQTEKSIIHLRFADEADIACPHCGQQRSCSTQVRPFYASVSGQPQDELLRRQRRARREAAAMTIEPLQTRERLELERLRAEREGREVEAAELQAQLLQTQQILATMADRLEALETGPRNGDAGADTAASPRARKAKGET